MLSRGALMTDGYYENGKIIVADQAGGNRLFSKGGYGIPRKGGGVILNLYESLCLIELGRLTVYMDSEPMESTAIINSWAAEGKISLSKYLVYFDLRIGRGIFATVNDSGLVTLSSRPDEPPNTVLCVVSEHHEMMAGELFDFISEPESNHIVAMIDDKCNISYYKVTEVQPHGSLKESEISQFTGTLFEDLVVVFDKNAFQGIQLKSSIGQLVNDKLYVSFMDAYYLLCNGKLIVKTVQGTGIDPDAFYFICKEKISNFDDKYAVYLDLRRRGMSVKTGFTFGGTFNVSSKNEHDGFSEYLVEAYSDINKLPIGNIPATSRVGGVTHKECVFGIIGEKSIRYLKFSHYKPGLNQKLVRR